MTKFEEEWRKRFERFAQDYCTDYLVSGWSESGLRRRLVLFEKLLRESELPASAHILDLGCGAGTYVRFLASIGYRVIGLDYSMPSLYRALAADPKRNGSYVGAEAYRLPFCNGCFDLVVSIGVLQALENPELALDEMIRILRPQGLLVIEFLNAFEIVSVLRSLGERLKGALPRLHTYSPFKVRRWLSHRGLRSIQRAGIYLPPRNLPWIERIFDLRGVVRLIEGVPGLSLIGAHAFLLIGKKTKA